MAAATRNMRAPAGVVNTKIYGASGATYQVDANGYVPNVAVPDISPLVYAGFSIMASPAADGLDVQALELFSGRTTLGVLMATAAAAGVFGISSSAGTSLFLASEAAQTNTKTDVVLFEKPMPQGYFAAQNLSPIINANYTGGGTVGTAVVSLNAYRIGKDGSQGADIAATAGNPVTITATAADYPFTVTGASLNQGDRVLFKVTMVLQETGGASAVTGRINSIRI